MLLKAMKNETLTENGAKTYKSSLNECLDLFALGGAYRNRSEEDVIDLFTKAYQQDELTALLILVYLRDIRGGQGERRFFRTVLKNLAEQNNDVVKTLIPFVPYYGRWDDLWCLLDTPYIQSVLTLVGQQLTQDVMNLDKGEEISLLGKWLPSENASSQETKRLAKIIRKNSGLSPKQYRKMLSELRAKIDIVERKMTQNQWSEIEYDKLPSKAGLQYRNAFYRHDKDRYTEFMMPKDGQSVKVNAGTLYPYEIVGKVPFDYWSESAMPIDDIERATLNNYWKNIPDYINGDSTDAIAVIDVSGSMSGTPMEVAVSLGLYVAERNKGKFKNHFITFHSFPELVELDENDDFCSKVQKIKEADWGGSTDLEATFDLILNTAINYNLPQSELPEILYIISDMMFDRIQGYNRDNETVIENAKLKFEAAGYKIPHLVFWNVDARMDSVPMIGKDGYTLVSGFSPSIFEMVMTRTTPEEFMNSVIYSERYQPVLEILKNR